MMMASFEDVVDTGVRLVCLRREYDHFVIVSGKATLSFDCSRVGIADKHCLEKGGSPGLVVMGGNSYSKGREFESWHHIMDGYFVHIPTYLL